MRNFLSIHLGGIHLHDEIPGVEGAAYAMSDALEKGVVEILDADIPPREYIEFCVNTTQFHLGTISHYFDRDTFMSNLDLHFQREGRHEGTESTSPSALWYVQLRLMLAVGKLFTGRKASSLGPPGVKYFIRAMHTLPNTFVLAKQPVLSIEILCLVALYLQCGDLRNAAYTYVSSPSVPRLSSNDKH